MVIRIAVCGRLSAQAQKVERFVEDWAGERKEMVQIKRFYTGEELLFETELFGAFSVAFLEMDLPGMSGVETAGRLRKNSRQVSIVFYAGEMRDFRELFPLSPVHFMECSISRQQVLERMDKVLKEQRLFYESFRFCYKHHVYQVNLREVLYFASDRRTVNILLETGREYLMYGKLDEVEQRLRGSNLSFVRIHQSYLINGRYVEEYHRGMVRLRNRHVLPVSRRRRDCINQLKNNIF